jgi:GT2 family glycosyltransferase
MSDHFVYVVAQSFYRPVAKGQASMFVLDRRDLSLRNHYIFRFGADVHSIWVADDVVYAVSTGTDEVLELTMKDDQVLAEQVIWRPDSNASRADNHHLNAIFGGRGDLLVSGFGKKAGPRWDSAKNGFIFNVSRGRPMATGLDHPHSLVAIDGAIAYCESRKMSARVLENERVQQLPGYTRGLCSIGDKLFVATSMGRQISKSTGEINNPAESGGLTGHCTISRLSLDSFKIEETIDLGVHAHEIYDLLHVEDVLGWEVASEMSWRDRAIRELSTALDQRTVWAKQSVEEVSKREGTIRDLQAQLKEFHAQIQELSTKQEEANAWTTRTTDEIADRNCIIEDLRTQIQELGTKLEEANACTTRMAQEIADQNRTMEDLRTQIQDRLPAADLEKRIEYQRMLRRVRKVLNSILPPNSTVAVVSKGDDELLDLDGRRGWHFPQDAAGAYTGFAPADSGSAIIQLEALRANGADYLVFPNTAYWWMDHYTGFREHLDRRYRRLARHDRTCCIYALREPTERASPGVWTAFENFLLGVERRYQREPAILDWGTDLDLAARFSRRTVFSPVFGTNPAHEPVLPYLNATVDVVAVVSADEEVLAEARRVALVAVVVFDRPKAGTEVTSDLEFRVQWQSDMQPKPLPSTSIIIPSYNGIALTEACIGALQENLPYDFRGEIIVIDDASTDDTPERMQRLAQQDPRIKSIRNSRNLGFLSTCNRAADLARGDILIFLNNDTLPQPGWLEPLLKIFEEHPDAGAVGGKLVYPDGRLQEAGGVIFSDGSAANFGRGDYEIDAPLYNYVRDVDYVTGALIATPRALFEKLGGLDPRYRPAYYEEVDYCLRVREAGWKVYYQPASVVIHLEGATCGTDPSSGQKRYQLVNRQKFVERWREALARQPENPNHFDAWTWYGLAVREDCEQAECAPATAGDDGSNGNGPLNGNGRGERTT